MSIKFDLRDTTLSTAQLVGLAIGRETQNQFVINEILRRAGYILGEKQWREAMEAAYAEKVNES